MAFLKKIEKPKVEDIEEAREKFINGGGLVLSDVEEMQKKDEWTRLVLRIRTDAVEQIDNLIKDRMGVTRTGWILQAIEEKLKRSKKEDN
jgi:hypothetical protein